MYDLAILDGWEDITESMEGDENPFTLAKEDGAGALQMSYAEQSPGASATVDHDILLELDDHRSARHPLRAQRVSQDVRIFLFDLVLRVLGDLERVLAIDPDQVDLVLAP